MKTLTNRELSTRANKAVALRNTMNKTWPESDHLKMVLMATIDDAYQEGYKAGVANIALNQQENKGE